MATYLDSFTGHTGATRLLQKGFLVDLPIDAWAVCRVGVDPIDGTLAWGPRAWERPGSLPMLWMSRAWMPSMGPIRTTVNLKTGVEHVYGELIVVSDGQQWGVADQFRKNLIDLDGRQTEWLTPADRPELSHAFNLYCRWLAAGD
jgi:hypothetical protein